MSTRVAGTGATHTGWTHGLRPLDAAALERYLIGSDPMAVFRLAGLSKLSSKYIAVRCGVADVTVRRWRQVGIHPHVADVVAITLGTHPAIIWPEWIGPVNNTQKGNPR